MLTNHSIGQTGAALIHVTLYFDQALYPSAKSVQSTTLSAKVSLTLSQFVLLNFDFPVPSFGPVPKFGPCFLPILFFFLYFLLLFPSYSRRLHLAGIRLRCGGARFGFSENQIRGSFHRSRASRSQRKEHKTQKRNRNATTSVVSVSFPLDWQLFTRSLHFSSQSRRVTLRTTANKNTIGRSLSFRFSNIRFIVISPSKQYGPDIKNMVQYFASTAKRLRFPWCRHLSISVIQPVCSSLRPQHDIQTTGPLGSQSTGGTV